MEGLSEALRLTDGGGIPGSSGSNQEIGVMLAPQPMTKVRRDRRALNPGLFIHVFF
jgi:hypothetical protein